MFPYTGEHVYTEVNEMVENNVTTDFGYENMYTNVLITTVSFFYVWLQMYCFSSLLLNIL